MPSLSIIIPVYNGAGVISRCLDSVFSSSMPGTDVIVVDDGSADHTRSIVKQYPCRFLQNKINRGAGAARNRGIEVSTADFILFTDADCVVPEHWASTAVRLFSEIRERDPLVIAMEGRILPGPGFIRRCDAFAAYGYNQTGAPRYQDHFCTSNIITDRLALAQVGNFDERFRVLEDRDLGVRLMRAGGRIYYHPELRVTHFHERMTLGSFLKHEFVWGRTVGNHFDDSSLSSRSKWLSPFFNHRIPYFCLAPIVATVITAKITLKNIFYDFSVVIYFPFIFLSKLAYRLGACLSLRGISPPMRGRTSCKK